MLSEEKPQRGYLGSTVDGCTDDANRYTDTPRTDAFAAKWNLAKGLADNGPTYGWGSLSEAVDEMRQLERELAAERRQYAQCADALNRALQSASGAVAWIATNELGSVLHLAKADGWNVEVVAVDRISQSATTDKRNT